MRTGCGFVTVLAILCFSNQTVDAVENSCSGGTCPSSFIQSKTKLQKNQDVLSFPERSDEDGKQKEEQAGQDGEMGMMDTENMNQMKEDQKGHDSKVLDASGTLLQVTIVAASNLPNTFDVWNKPDVFVEVEIKGQDGSRMKAGKTGTQDNTVAPRWDEKFDFPSYVAGDTLILTVWDEDGWKNDKVGDVEFVPDCKNYTMNLNLPKDSSLQVKIECATKASYLLMESMVMLAMRVAYKGETDEYKGWQRAKYVEAHGDQLAVYKKNNECVVSFLGTNDNSDMWSNVKVWPTRKCGHYIHRGFYKETLRYISTQKFKEEVSPFLASNECSDGIYAVGHSLGGSVAEIFTTCVNEQKDWIKGNPFVVKEVYSTGAPAVGWWPLQNNSGCFKGARIYNEDEKEFDPVPLLTQLAKFKHPNLKAIRLKKAGEGIVAKEFKCMSEEAVRGNNVIIAKLASLIELPDAFKLHFPKAYMDRMKILVR